MALKESCGKGRFSNFSIAKLLEKGEEEEEEREESEDEETRVVGPDDDWEVKTKEEVENGNEDQVLAALGNIGRWQVQIIMITGQDI